MIPAAVRKHAYPISLLAGLAFVLASAGWSIHTRQQIVDHGQTVLLPLRPVDPRSLMQGDYMDLRYARSVFPDIALRKTLPRSGTVVLTLDDAGVGTFARMDDGTALAPNEVRLAFRVRHKNSDPDYAANDFFFQEGHAGRYQSARFGVLKVNAEGTVVLIGLADAEGRVLGGD